jgi:hypothetical protein
MPTADDWYDRNPDVKQLFQGDILDDIPFVLSPPKSKRWVLLRPLPQGPIEQSFGGLPRSFRADVDRGYPTAWTRPDGELVMANAYPQRVMILSQSCNIDWRKHVQVCPVYPAVGLGAADLEHLRANDVGYWFYLPEDGARPPYIHEIPESYGDLSLATTVSSSYLRPDALLRRLTSLATFEFQNSLSDYFARPFGFNVHDQVKQKAIYRCVTCFVERRLDIAPIEIDVGGTFPGCKACGDKALWIKVGDIGN